MRTWVCFAVLATNCLTAGAEVLIDNGPFVTTPNGNDAGCPGDLSGLQSGPPLNLATYGFNSRSATGYWLADDFTLECAAVLSSITLYAYQTGSGIDPTVNAANVVILSGPPNVGEPAELGSSTVILSTAWTGAYRAKVADEPSPCARPIMEVVVSLPDIALPAGTYWIKYQLGGTLLSGPWTPPVTYVGLRGKEAANGLQFLGPQFRWEAAVDTCDPSGTCYAPQDFPFILEGEENCGQSCAGFILGDSDGSGAVNNFDIDAFVLAISQPDSYLTAFCGGDGLCAICRNDLDGSGAVNNFDIDGFVACLNAIPPPGQPCP
jgi:hypothetical protein